jgi:2-iminobutanoate/2-iminopropanoate deaminase
VVDRVHRTRTFAGTGRQNDGIRDPWQLAACRPMPTNGNAPMQRRRFCALGATAATAATTLPAGAAATADTAVPGLRLRPIAPTGLAYAQACEASGFSRLLFVSGQVPADADGRVPDAYPEQYRLAWRNVEAQLHAAGMDFDNLVKVTIFLSDRALIAQSAGLRQQVLGDRSPALTIVIAGIYDEAWLLEIEAVAAA